MKKVFPSSKLGWWSVGLIVAVPVLIILAQWLNNLFYFSVPAAETIIQDITTRPALSLTMLLVMVCGVLAFVTGITSIIKRKERAILAFISTCLGGLFILLLIAEFTFME